MIYLKLLGPWAVDNLKAISVICISISLACFYDGSFVMYVMCLAYAFSIFLYASSAVAVRAAELRHTYLSAQQQKLSSKHM